jgi:iron complex outermembrane receptor protein
VSSHPHLVLAAAAAGLCSSPTSAHEDVPPPAQQAGVVVITGAQPSSLPTRLPTTIEGLTAAQIEASVNATDSEDALKYLPSLLVRKRYIGDYNHAVLSTRASGTGNSARSLVYADGVLLSNLLGNGASFTPRWGLVTPEEIARVDVLYGPFSAAYAGNSVGAVVDYVTRMPTQFEAHAKLGAFVQPFALYSTNATYRGWQASASLGDRQGAFAWWINVNRLDSEGQPLVFVTGAQPPAGTTGAVPETDPRGQPWFILGTTTQMHTVQDHAKLKLAYDIDATLRANAVLGVWRNAAQGHAESYLRDAAGNTVTSASFVESQEEYTHAMSAVSLKRHAHGAFDWELAASAYDYRKDLQRTSAGRVTDMQGTGWNTLAFKTVLRPASSHVIDAGAQQETYALRTLVSSSSASRFDGNTRLRSIYGQDTWGFAPDWSGVLGLRVEHWNAWDGLTQSASGTLQHPARAATYASPKAALGFQASDEWSLKASLGRAVRVPTVSELYQGGLNNLGQQVNTNPDLRPERSWTAELSAQWSRDTLQWRVTPFFEDTRDALYSQLNAATNTNTVQNVDHVRTRGVETAFQARDAFVKGLELDGSLTYTHSKVLQDSGFPEAEGKDQIRVPRWRASLVATWHVNDRFDAALGARYGSRQYSRLDNADTNGFAYTAASKYAVADLRLRYRFDRQWSAAFGIDNLNNYQYWNFHPYPQRTYSAELKYDL